MEKSTRVGTDPRLQREASGPSAALAGGCCRCGLLSGADHSSLCLLQTNPAALPHVNEPGPTMGPAALLGSAVTLDVSSPFFPGRLEDQVGDGNEGGVPGLSKWVCACLFDRATPRGEFSCTYNRRVAGGAAPSQGLSRPRSVLAHRAESRKGACYSAHGVPGLLGSLV